MKRIKIFCLLAVMVVHFLIPRFLYAAEKNWELKNYQAVRIDRKREKDHTYLNRLGFPIYYRFSGDLDVKLEVQPFAETQYKWDAGEWSRTEAGIEVGFRLTQWAYAGESIHYAWLEENENTPELETRLEMNIPFVLNSTGYKLTLALIEEYTYATRGHKASRNEIAANIIIPVCSYLELVCGWRHIDRIHDYDSDQVEVGGLIKF